MRTEDACARFLRLGIHVTPEDINKFGFYGLERWSDERFVTEYAQTVQKFWNEKHIRMYLESFDAESKKVNRNYYKGTVKWRRKDKMPLDNYDIQALKTKSYGQSHSLVLAKDNEYATINWACDSTG